jgi:integrase
VKAGTFAPPRPSKHTLGDLIDRYARAVLPAKRDGQTQARQLAWWKTEIGDRLLSEVTPALLAEKRDKLSEGTTPRGPRTPATVVRYLAAMSHCLTVAVKEYGWMEDNPMLKVTRPKEPRGRVRFLSDDERQTLFAACKESDNPALYPAAPSLLCLARAGKS